MNNPSQTDIPKNVFVLANKGLYKEGDVLVFDGDDKELEEGGKYLVSIQGNLSVLICIIKDNKLVLPLDESQPYTILGRLMYIGIHEI